MTLTAAKAAAVAHWAFDEASGDRTDSINSIVLTDTNTVTSTTGVFSNCAVFNSSNSEYFTTASSSTLQMGDVDFTIRVWVRLTTVPVAGRQFVLVCKDGIGTTGAREYALDYDRDTSRFRFVVFKATDSSVVVSANNFGAPSTATWYLVHAWHDSANDLIGISVNAGTADTQSTSGSLQSASTAAFEVGNRTTSSGGRLLDGRLDDLVVIKNYVMSADDRTDDYNSGTGVAFADWPSVTAPIISSVTLTGTSQVGNTLTATVVTDQDPVDSTAYQWQKAATDDAEPGTDISGETSQTLALTYADFGDLLDTAAYVRCQAIATKNSQSSTEVASDWQAVTAPSGNGVVVRIDQPVFIL